MLRTWIYRNFTLVYRIQDLGIITKKIKALKFSIVYCFPSPKVIERMAKAGKTVISIIPSRFCMWQFSSVGSYNLRKIIRVRNANSDVMRINDGRVT